MKAPQSPPRNLRALVVDDERAARRRLLELLGKYDVTEVMEAQDGEDAVSKIETARPDLVFLDIQMPGISGFDVIDALGAEHMPLTIFVTAYDRFAVRAFEENAIDYLLKPVSEERFDLTMQRVTRLAQIPSGNSTASQPIGPLLPELIAKNTKPGAYWNWVVVKSHGLTKFVMAENIDWIEAKGVYVSLHAQGSEFLYRASLTEVCDRLDPSRFVRIHRSHLVNINSIEQLEKKSHGEFDVLLTDGSRLVLSRSYRTTVERALGQPL
jgi:two-component system, LytTR family, response regulator